MIKNKIIDEIQKEDRGISLEKFIDICLFDNEGYYETSNPLGKSGDFITSPEISQLFGEILGLYIHGLWRDKFKENFNLIKLEKVSCILITLPAKELVFLTTAILFVFSISTPKKLCMPFSNPVAPIESLTAYKFLIHFLAILIEVSLTWLRSQIISAKDPNSKAAPKTPELLWWLPDIAL